MGYATSPFGNNVLVGSGGNVTSQVSNHYGPRTRGGTIGVDKVEGMKEELVFDVTGDFFTDKPDGLVPFVLPAGAVIKDVYIDVITAFSLGGTTPTLLIGTNGSEATNGFVVSKTILEGTGSSNLTSTLAGTWDSEAPLAANTQIGMALGGTTPTITRAGKARITVMFDRINRAPSPALAGGPALP